MYRVMSRLVVSWRRPANVVTTRCVPSPQLTAIDASRTVGVVMRTWKQKPARRNEAYSSLAEPFCHPAFVAQKRAHYREADGMPSVPQNRCPAN